MSCTILYIRDQLEYAIEFFEYKSILHYRGIIKCLKLSPNLRKQTPEVQAATFTDNKVKVLNLERKILHNILEMAKK